uniref:TMF-regulated nuclear protein 1 n=1 Tax=Pogona vitticeps TaxID=103695 RepID=A0ABM5ESJ9_9SAUR
MPPQLTSPPGEGEKQGRASEALGGRRAGFRPRSRRPDDWLSEAASLNAPSPAPPARPSRYKSAADRRLLSWPERGTESRRGRRALPAGRQGSTFPSIPGGGAGRPPLGSPPPRADRAMMEPPEPQREAAAAAGRGLEVAKSRGGGAGSGAAAAVRGALELAEARRRLLEAEGQRRLVSELERRVHQLHRVFLEAELRLAHRAESLGRLGGGVAQAELHLAAAAAAGSPLHGPRLRKAALPRGRPKKLLRPPARLLASALGLGGCVPWAGGQKQRPRGGRAPEPPPPPESPFRRPSLRGAPPANAPPRSWEGSGCRVTGSGEEE